MNIWFLVWIFLSVLICGVFAWSMQILLKQKQVWKQFALRHKLTYENPAFLKSPVVSGLYKNLPLEIFSEAQTSDDQRGRRFRTIVQFELSSGMPVEGVVASRHYHRFANNLTDLTEVFAPDHPGWSDAILMKTQNSELLRPYLTPARCAALLNLMTIKGFNALFIFDRNSTFLRLETADPLYDLPKMERLIEKIENHARVLALR